MKKGLVITSLAVALTLALSACTEDKKAEEKAPATSVATEATFTINEKTTAEDKTAYAIGASVGAYLHAMQEAQKEFITPALNQDIIMEGFKDSLLGKNQLSNEDMDKVLREFDSKIQQALQKKAQEEAKANLEAGKKFLEENKTKEGVVVTQSGLQYKVIKEGTGAQVKGTDTVLCKYKGTDINGNVFDEAKEAVELPLENMISGIHEGLQLMKEGSVYEFYLPSELAYGEQAVGDMIKPNSVLCFTFEIEKIVTKEDPATQNAQETTEVAKDTK